MRTTQSTQDVTATGPGDAHTTLFSNGGEMGKAYANIIAFSNLTRVLVF